MNDGLTVSQSQIDSNLHLDKHLAPAGLGQGWSWWCINVNICE